VRALSRNPCARQTAHTYHRIHRGWCRFAIDVGRAQAPPAGGWQLAWLSFLPNAPLPSESFLCLKAPDTGRTPSLTRHPTRVLPVALRMELPNAAALVLILAATLSVAGS
jgi:hypothetical protein